MAEEAKRAVSAEARALEPLSPSDGGWDAALSAFNARHDGSPADPPLGWPVPAKESLLSSLLSLIAADREGAEPRTLDAVRAAKTLTRTRTGLAALFEDGAVAAVLALVAASDGRLQLEAVTLLSNMLVLNRTPVLRAAAAAGTPAALMAALDRRRGDAPFAFIASRALFVSVLDPEVASPLVTEHGAYRVLLDAVVGVVGPAASRVELTAGGDERFAARRGASELMKVLFNLIGEQAWPGPATELDAEGNARLAGAVRDILAASSAPRTPEQLDERVARADAAELARKRQAAREYVERVRAEKGDAAAAEAEAGSAAIAPDDGGIDGGAGAEPEAAEGPDEYDSPVVAEDVSARPPDPMRPTLLSVKSAASNLLLYLPREVTDAVGGSPAAVQGLMEVLDCMARRPVTRRGEQEENLTPIFLVLKLLFERCEPARDYGARYIFGRRGSPEAREAGGGALGMQPQGQKDERRDPKPSWCKAVIVACMTSFSMHLKPAAEEMIWAMVGEQSNEFIRLLGFGNAVGLLANKGLPGFAHLSQNAIDLDELMRAKGGRKGGGAKVEEVDDDAQK